MLRAPVGGAPSRVRIDGAALLELFGSAISAAPVRGAVRAHTRGKQPSLGAGHRGGAGDRLRDLGLSNSAEPRSRDGVELGFQTEV